MIFQCSPCPMYPRYPMIIPSIPYVSWLHLHCFPIIIHHKPIFTMGMGSKIWLNSPWLIICLHLHCYQPIFFPFVFHIIPFYIAISRYPEIYLAGKRAWLLTCAITILLLGILSISTHINPYFPILLVGICSHGPVGRPVGTSDQMSWSLSRMATAHPQTWRATKATDRDREKKHVLPMIDIVYI